MVLSPAAYRRVTFWALVLLAVIVVTGAAVRLSGSGLGCSDWPNCERGQLAPAQIDDAPAWIEFGNRLVTGVVSVAVIVAVLGAHRRAPRRRDLELLAWALVVGVVAQIILGGLVVQHHLSPRFVMGHFSLSMVLVWDAVVLHHRAGTDRAAPASDLPAGTAALGRGIVAVAALVVFTGTIVTAAGPHAGDSQAARLDLPIGDAARLHGVAVVLLLGLALAFARRATGAARRGGHVLLAVLVAQAAVGYTQYFTGVPAALVAVHIAGALSVWIAAVRLPLLTAAAAPEPEPELQAA